MADAIYMPYVFRGISLDKISVAAWLPSDVAPVTNCAAICSTRSRDAAPMFAASLPYEL
jgi:hypothetical protein